MKVISWLLAILSFLALPALFAVWGIAKLDDAWWEILIIGVALYALLGMGAHMCITEDYKYGESGTKFLYFVTFPAFILAFGVYLILKLLIKVLKTVFNAMGGNSGSSSSSKRSEKVYVIYDNSTYSERRLKMTEYLKRDYSSFGEVMGSDYYNRFIDDLGNYWRSYDGNKTYISEREIKAMGYDI